MLRGVFVTGTDTGVGKTAVCAALVYRYRATEAVRYWKPVQTGFDRDDDTAEVARLSGCTTERILARGIRLPRPVSPHLAAQLSGQSIDLDALAAMPSAEAAASWIVEGAGGVLVPLTKSAMMVDFIGILGLPAIVVARTALGTINHTLLTLEALRHRSVRVAGVVMVGPLDVENRGAVERYGGTEVIGELPTFDPLTPNVLQQWAATALDPRGLVGVHL